MKDLSQLDSATDSRREKEKQRLELYLKVEAAGFKWEISRTYRKREETRIKKTSTILHYHLINLLISSLHSFMLNDLFNFKMDQSYQSTCAWTFLGNMSP